MPSATTKLFVQDVHPFTGRWIQRELQATVRESCVLIVPFPSPPSVRPSLPFGEALSGVCCVCVCVCVCVLACLFVCWYVCLCVCFVCVLCVLCVFVCGVLCVCLCECRQRSKSRPRPSCRQPVLVCTPNSYRTSQEQGSVTAGEAGTSRTEAPQTRGRRT